MAVCARACTTVSARQTMTRQEIRVRFMSSSGDWRSSLVPSGLLDSSLVRLEPREPATLATVRRIVLGLVALGTLGMLVELVLVGHYDDANQLIPLGIAVLGLVAIVWAAVT